MDRIIFSKGLEAQIPSIPPDVGKPGYTTDTRKLIIGDGSTNPPQFISNKSTGLFSYQSLDGLTLPGGLQFLNAKPGAIGPITPARMVQNTGLLAYRGQDGNQQDTWGEVGLSSSDNTITVTNGSGQTGTAIDLKFNQNSAFWQSVLQQITNATQTVTIDPTVITNQITNSFLTNHVLTNMGRTSNNYRNAISNTASPTTWVTGMFNIPFKKLLTGSRVICIATLSGYQPSIGVAAPTVVRLIDQGSGLFDQQYNSGTFNLSGVGAVSIPGFCFFMIDGIPPGNLMFNLQYARQDNIGYTNFVVNPDSADFTGSGGHTTTGATSVFTFGEYAP